MQKRKWTFWRVLTLIVGCALLVGGLASTLWFSTPAVEPAASQAGRMAAAMGPNLAIAIVASVLTMVLGVVVLALR